MAKEKLFLLLDIDGVLLEAEGYRLACIDTINDFLAQMGQPGFTVDREITDRFEASGISCEWDMVPLSMAAFADWYCEITGDELTEAFPPVCHKVIDRDNADFRKMLLEKIDVYSQMLDPNETCINAIYHTLLKTNGKGLYFLWTQPIRDRFFVDTLDPNSCPFFAGLMNRLLGSEIFHEFYGIEAPFLCDSYLQTKDRLLISPKNRKYLMGLAPSSIFPVVMTYRPSKYPEISGNKSALHFVCTPEGECALQLLGWSCSSVKMIGAGSLCYIEEKYGLRREHYVKPHPFHALASVMMGICGDEILALEKAHQLCVLDPEEHEFPAAEWFSKEDTIRIAVFEDSVSGIRSAGSAVEIFRKWGYNAFAVLCGIRTTESKNKLLQNEGADLFSDFNDALDSVLKAQNRENN